MDAFRPRYEIGKKQLQDTFGVQVVEMTNTLKGEPFNYENPQARVDDLHEAFANPEIKAVISCIGGSDSVRLIDKIDYDLLRKNPKIFLGYSDSTVTHHALLKAGLRSYYGPSILSGFAENCGMHDYLVDSVRRTLFSPAPIGEIKANPEGWTNEHVPWEEPGNENIRRKMHPPMPWQFIQGTEKTSGRLIGGCTDVLPMIVGTSVWPSVDMFDNAILFLENSEEAISTDQMLYIMRNLGAIGILERINGLIFSRPHRIAIEKFPEYDATLLKALKEFGRADLPVITRMDFGHTDPMFLLPFGAMATIDPAHKRFSIDEPGCA